MKKVLLIENFSEDFYKARLPLAKFLISKGWQVFALIPSSKYNDSIEQEGIRVLEYQLDRKDKGILQLFRLCKLYNKIIREEKIDVIHSFRFQPNLLNTLVNFFKPRKRVLLHITGLGIAFSNSSFHFRFLRLLSQLIFQLKFFRANSVIVQNEDDASDILFSKYWKRKIAVIYGSGVNTRFFDPSNFDRALLRSKNGIDENEIVFVCVSRLIWEKGIDEMMHAFKSLVVDHPNIKLIIIGWSDSDNPRHVTESYIDEWNGRYNINFLGKKENVGEWLALSDCFIYPSYYREGIPRSILEALSMGLPIITTNMPGCKLTVAEGENGYMIEPRFVKALTISIKNICNADRASMSARSRQIAQSLFSDQIIFSEIESLYHK